MFKSEGEIDGLMSLIREGKLPNGEFTHRRHLAMAACIVFEGGTLEDVRNAILSLNAANNVAQTPSGGYHETLTVAWHALIANHMATLPVETPRMQAVNSVLHALDDKRVILAHYTKDRIMSWEARVAYVEPDVTPLPEFPTRPAEDRG